jgi:magnesium chelatase subunit D
MGVEHRLLAAREAVLSLLVDAYQRRDRVALVSFRGEGAEVVLRPTGSTEVASARLRDLPTGGRTPLSAGIELALRTATAGGGDYRPILVLVSDGRATWAPDGSEPMAAALAAAGAVRRAAVDALVVDCETGTPRLGLAARMAHAMGGRCVPTGLLTGDSLAGAVREGMRGRRRGPSS